MVERDTQKWKYYTSQLETPLASLFLKNWMGVNQANYSATEKLKLWAENIENFYVVSKEERSHVWNFRGQEICLQEEH